MTSVNLLAGRSGDLVRHVETGILMGIASRYPDRPNTVLCLWPNIFGSWRHREFDIGELAMVRRSPPPNDALLASLNITPADVWERMVEALEAQV